MTAAEIMEKMIANTRGHLHDISHFMSVWGYARTIGEYENGIRETNQQKRIWSVSA